MVACMLIVAVLFVRDEADLLGDLMAECVMDHLCFSRVGKYL